MPQPRDASLDALHDADSFVSIRRHPRSIGIGAELFLQLAADLLEEARELVLRHAPITGGGQRKSLSDELVAELDLQRCELGEAHAVETVGVA